MKRTYRIPAIDMARGLAVVGMFGYHLTWDLAHFGFIADSAPFSPGFRLYSHVVQAPVFNIPALIWTGLGTIEPSSNDYRPFFPWAAPTLAGVGLMALGHDRIVAFLSRWNPGERLWQILAWGGRHSLIIYLVHQPLFFGGLAGLAAIAPPGGADGVFMRPCEAQCAASDAPEQTCQAVCACAAPANPCSISVRSRANCSGVSVEPSAGS